MPCRLVRKKNRVAPPPKQKLDNSHQNWIKHKAKVTKCCKSSELYQIQMLKHHWGKKTTHNTLWYETLKMYVKNCVTENLSIFLLPRIKTGINQQLKGLKVILLWAFVHKNQSADEIIQAERQSKCFKRYFPLKRRNLPHGEEQQQISSQHFFPFVMGKIY